MKEMTRGASPRKTSGGGDVPMTTISGFHQDAAGDWIAELACGHTQHMRHRPPWESRPWVMTEAGRAAKVGAAIGCPLCGRDPSR